MVGLEEENLLEEQTLKLSDFLMGQVRRFDSTLD
jgi:hypothetical protein